MAQYKLLIDEEEYKTVKAQNEQEAIKQAFDYPYPFMEIMALHENEWEEWGLK